MLALPYTFSYLTWAGGLILLFLSASVSLYTSWLLAALHQDERGIRHNRYLDLGQHVLGNLLLIMPLHWHCTLLTKLLFIQYHHQVLIT